MNVNWTFWLEMVVKALVVFGVLQGSVSYLVYAERRIASYMQDRIGPNRCGPFGLFQPIADAVKLLFKEDITPRHVNTAFFLMAPVLSVMPALATLVAVPFGADLVMKNGRVIELQVADVNVGLLTIFALASLGVYGLALGGWSSGSKYSLLGGIRSSAQMVSYELALTLSVLCVVMTAGSLQLNDIIMQQGPWPWQWNLFGFGAASASALYWPWRLVAAVPLLVAGVMFMVSVLAETNRLPFDLPEAESELVSGYHTEYSSMKFGLYFLAEYANMVTGSALVAALFLGGWMFPGWNSEFMREHVILQGVLMVATFVAKLAAFLFFMMWIRWTLPRFRFDQLMELGWKRFLPISLGCVVFTAIWRVVLDRLSA